MRKVLMGLFLAALFLSLAASQADKSYMAEHFLVAAEVEPGGSLRVQENVTFRFMGGPFTFVFRELPTDFTDGIVDIVASVDGRVLSEGSGPGQVEIEHGNPIRLTWHMEPTSNTAREFGLNYTMLGAVRQEQNSDLLWWWPLPDAYEYAIGSSQITVVYPPGWTLASQPSVAEGQATIAVEPGHVLVNAGAMQPNEALLISIPFQAGSVLNAPPNWQAQQRETIKQETSQQAQQDDLAWIWFTLGGLVLLGGTALLLRARAPYRREEEKWAGLAYEPPGDLPPAIAGALRSESASVTWEQALGTLFDLAARGFLVIEQLPKQRWSGNDFLIRLKAEPTGLRPHETSLLDLLLRDKKGQRHDSVKMSKLSNIISSGRWKEWSEQLEDELVSEGYVSPARKKARGKTMALSLIPIGSILAVAVVLVVFHSTFGWWPLVLGGALIVLAIIALVLGGSISALSDDGAKKASEWEPFYRYLKEVSRGKAAPANEDEFERYLPYAAAYGQLHAWAKRFEKRGWTETPAYFRPLSGAGQMPMSSFVAFAAVSASSGGSASTSAAGGAGAAGAAGGGASGAG